MESINAQPASLKDRWKIRKDMALTFAGITTPLIVAVIGGMYNMNAKESENRVRYVELAITQLRAAPSPETAALRAWAVELLADQSPTPLSTAAKEQLKTNVLPVVLSVSAHGATMSSGTAAISAGKASASNN